MKKTIIVNNGNGTLGDKPKTVKQLLIVLGREPLDPKFEKYGNFCTPILPKNWSKNRFPRELKRTKLSFWGNFLNLSHSFCIHTKNKAVANKLRAAIKKNQMRADYLLASKAG